jgi:hypothetical protein
MVKRGPKVVEGGEVVSIREFFDKLHDPRSTVNQKHRLGDIIVICVCAVISGADGPTAIRQWAMMKRDWLERILEPENGIPSRSTIALHWQSSNPQHFKIAFSRGSLLLRRRKRMKVRKHLLLKLPSMVRLYADLTIAAEDLDRCFLSVLGQSKVE